MHSAEIPLQNDQAICVACASRVVIDSLSKPTDFIRCPRCRTARRGLLPSENALKILYSKAYSARATAADETGCESEEGMLRGLAKLLRSKCLKAGDRVLDFGAGVGRFSSILRSWGFEVQGLEPSQQARAEASSRFGFSFAATISQLCANYYDWVVAIEVFEHLIDPGEEFSRLRNVLKPGGGLFLTTPNALGLAARVKGARWREASNEFHLTLFTSAGLTSLLKRSGYEQVKYITFSSLGTVPVYRAALHRMLQAFGLYGGLRVTARTPKV